MRPRPYRQSAPMPRFAYVAPKRPFRLAEWLFWLLAIIGIGALAAVVWRFHYAP